jgi:hypothetical protein
MKLIKVTINNSFESGEYAKFYKQFQGLVRYKVEYRIIIIIIIGQICEIFTDFPTKISSPLQRGGIVSPFSMQSFIFYFAMRFAK